MKKFTTVLILFGLILGQAFGPEALALISTNQKYQLNNRMGGVARQVQLGTLIQNAEGLEGPALASGKIIVGNGSGVAAAVTPSGDATISNAGVISIGSSKITSAMIVDGVVAEGDVVAASTSGLGLKRIARATFDTAAGNGAIGAHSLGVQLPAKAIIQRSFFFVKTQFVDAGAGTVALHCETADNIFAAADITGIAANAITTGVSDGATANMKLMTAACNITATVAGADQTSGKLDVFVEYVVAE